MTGQISQKELTVPNCNHMETANAVCTHLSSIGKNLKSLDRLSVPVFLPAAEPRYIQPWDVVRIINKLNTRKAGGPDMISARFIKTFSYELAEPLSCIINASYRALEVPSEWKLAHVVTITKDPKLPATLDNIRPIALTDLFAKNAEHFVARDTLKEMNTMLDPMQFGNQRKVSISHCLISLMDSLYRHAEIPSTVSSILFTDFSKAFDLVDHTIAVFRLINMNVSPTNVAWIADFLSNRHYQVKYRGHLSDSCIVKGPKLAPSFFVQ
ncbi:uncharacterized protein LOC117101534 [Anneissia japonica]|uniref:uncharacterized protein LOC117101534 n=1 Tax=Anneissia japonica TaxID=1529436 RepID=UPI001425859B|nr:uncharacterized protein LOC117101534 [Anneissia japonica]